MKLPRFIPLCIFSLLYLLHACGDSKPLKLTINLKYPQEIISLWVTINNKPQTVDSVSVDLASTSYYYTLLTPGKAEIEYIDCFRNRQKIPVDLQKDSAFEIPALSLQPVSVTSLLAETLSDTFYLFIQNMLADSVHYFHTQPRLYSIQLIKRPNRLAVHTISYSINQQQTDIIYNAELPNSYTDSLFTALQITERGKTDRPRNVCTFKGQLNLRLYNGNRVTDVIKVDKADSLFNVFMRLTGE